MDLLPKKSSKHAPALFPLENDDIEEYLKVFRKLARKYKLDEEEKCDLIIKYMHPHAQRLVEHTRAYNDEDWPRLKRRIRKLFGHYSDEDWTGLSHIPSRNSKFAPLTFPNQFDTVSEFLKDFHTISQYFQLSKEEKCEGIMTYLRRSTQKWIKETKEYKHRDWKGLKRKLRKTFGDDDLEDEPIYISIPIPQYSPPNIPQDLDIQSTDTPLPHMTTQEEGISHHHS